MAIALRNDEQRQQRQSIESQSTTSSGNFRSACMLVVGLLGCGLFLIYLDDASLKAIMQNQMEWRKTARFYDAKNTPPTSIVNGEEFRPSESRIPTYQSKLHYEERRNVTAKAGELFVYRGVSGLGHRLVRMSGAFHAAKIMNVSNMWSSWGWECGVNENGHPDIFDHLFGIGPMVVEQPPPPPPSKENTTASLYDDMLLYFQQKKLKNNSRIINEVPGYMPVRGCYRDIFASTYKLNIDKAISDKQFYRQLRSLFRFNDRVQSFVDEHRFSERIVVGIHIRAGNGEAGDFKEKERGIRDIDAWLVNTAKMIHQLTIKIRSAYSKEINQQKPLSPLVFIATDDPRVVNKLANATSRYNISTVAFPQERLDSGSGVAYNHKWDTNEACREGWVNQFIDATLLGAADVAIAGTYSSFSQSVALMTVLSESVVSAQAKDSKQTGHSMTLTNGASRFAHRLFCEVHGVEDTMRCYDNYLDWLYANNQLHWTSSSTNGSSTVDHRKEVYVPCIM